MKKKHNLKKILKWYGIFLFFWSILALINLNSRANWFGEVYFPFVANYEPLTNEIGEIKKLKPGLFKYGYDDNRPVFKITTKNNKKYKIVFTVEHIDTNTVEIKKYDIIKSY